jgi:hypothetical protein
VSVSLVLGELRQLASVYGPGTAVLDGNGGFTESQDALTPATWWCAIEKATVRAAESRFAATVTAQASHILRGRYHPGITSKSTIVWTDRNGTQHRANVLDSDDTEGAGVELVLLVSEIVP